MQKRKFDELVSYFNKKVSEMEIETKYKMELLGMVTALGCAHEKEMSDLSETKQDSSGTISREAAIEVLNKLARDNFTINDAFAFYLGALHDAADEIKTLPSAQSEIIRCKDCKHHWTHKCMDSMPIERCDLEQTFYDSERDFCSLAERRTDG